MDLNLKAGGESILVAQSSKDYTDIRKKYSSHDPSQCGIVWSENPDIPKWQVKLMLHSSEPEKVEERYGFVVLSTMEKTGDDGSSKKIVKLNSQHHPDSIDTEMFRKFMKKGLPFTRLEFAGPFLNNVSICPDKYTVGSDVPVVEVSNLKCLVLKPKITLAVKGDERSLQDTYYRIHRSFFESMKTRTAKNLWFILKSIYGPKLHTLQIQDFVDWDDDEMEGSRDDLYRYWDQALGGFIERHSSTLKSLRASPIPVQCNTEFKSSNSVRPILDIPCLSDLYFCPKISTRFDGPAGLSKNFESWLRHEHVGNQLHLWKEILGAQKALNNIGWICDTWNPFPLNRKDFVRLCEENPHTENLMLILHGDEKFRLHFGAQDKMPPLNLKDFQINCTVFHGLFSLRVMTVGCCSNDPQSRTFCLYNLNLLPKSLEAIHFSGVRIPVNELLMLRRLPKLKSLTIFEDKALTGPALLIGGLHDEGVTEKVMKTFIHMRSLEELVIVGIPVVLNEAEDKKGIDSEAGGGGFFAFFGMMCACLDNSGRGESSFLQEPGSSTPNEEETKYLSLLQSLKEVGKVSQSRIADESDKVAITTSFAVGKSAEASLTLFHRA